MQRQKLARGWLLLTVVAALAQAAVAFAGPPYDPRPLMPSSANDNRFTFAVFGDSYARPPLATLLKTVDALSPDFTVVTGDMVEDGAGKDGPKNWQMLSDNAGWFFSKRASWPVIGNHEVDSDFKEGLANFVRFYNAPGQEYSFTFGNAKFIVLGIDPEWRLVSPDQVEFLKKELADRDAYRHVFVFRHVPFYTVGMKEADQVANKETEIVKLLNDKKVTAVFSGHDHMYYRTRRNGVTHIISGVAAAGIYDLVRVAEQAPGDAYMGVSVAEDQVILHVPGRVDRSAPFKGYYESGDESMFAVLVHVNGDRVTAETVSVDGEVWDSFVISGQPFTAVQACGAAGGK
jgi:3',5'-cyclic AMP phosphodiesterase CpdA